MKQVDLTVISNRPLNALTYELKLSGDIGAVAAGQFVEIAVEGFYLRRPFGVADCEDGVLTLLYRVQGKGTEAMTKLSAGAKVNVLTGLGNGFNLAFAEKPLIIGGGMGIAPLYFLAKTLCASGKKPVAVLGFKSKEEAFYIEEFKKYAMVIVATDDGSIGFHGNALQAVLQEKPDYDFYYACGPEVMLKHVVAANPCGEVSLEARMGCGFGACMGCSIQTKNGVKRVCKEGPVFSAKEVLL